METTVGARRPQNLSLTQRPVEKAFTLPNHWYTSEEHYRLEVDRIFMRDWLCVGRTDEVPKAGDYFTIAIAGEPIVVVRDGDGKIHALSTVCRHRNALVVEGQGTCRRFECPIHGRTYALNGELVGAPDMKVLDFNRKDHGLAVLGVDGWEGFLFVNFDATAAPLGSRLTNLGQKYSNYRMNDLRATKRMVFENACNWKLSVEQGVDMYHVPTIHAEVDPSNYLVPRTTFESDSAGFYATSDTPTKEPHPYVSGTAMGASPFPAIAGLSDHELRSFGLALVCPNAVLAPVPDGMLYLLFFPKSVDRTTVVLNLCYPLSTVAMPGFIKHLRDAQDGFIELNYQDMRGARLAQAGMNSRLAVRGRYSHLERTTWDLNQYVISRLSPGGRRSSRGKEAAGFSTAPRARARSASG